MLRHGMRVKERMTEAKMDEKKTFFLAFACVDRCSCHPN